MPQLLIRNAGAIVTVDDRDTVLRIDEEETIRRAAACVAELPARV